MAPRTLKIEGGTICKVTNYFDCDGNEVDQDAPTDEVFVVVAEHPDGKFITQEVGPEMVRTGTRYS